MTLPAAPSEIGATTVSGSQRVLGGPGVVFVVLLVGIAMGQLGGILAPALVDEWRATKAAGGVGMSEAHAGLTTSLEILCVALGAGVFSIQPLRLGKRLLTALAATSAGLYALAASAATPEAIIPLRATAGLLSGLVLGRISTLLPLALEPQRMAGALTIGVTLIGVPVFLLSQWVLGEFGPGAVALVHAATLACMTAALALLPLPEPAAVVVRSWGPRKPPVIELRIIAALFAVGLADSMLYPFLSLYGQPLGVTGQSLLQLLLLSALVTPLGAAACYLVRRPEATLRAARLLIAVKAAGCAAYVLAPNGTVLGTLFVVQGLCFFAIVPKLQSLLARLDSTGDSVALSTAALLAAQGTGPLVTTALLATTTQSAALFSGALAAGLLGLAAVLVLPRFRRGPFVAAARARPDHIRGDGP